MGNLIYAIGHGLFAFALLFVWFMPIFQVRLTLGQKQKEYTKNISAEEASKFSQGWKTDRFFKGYSKKKQSISSNRPI